MCSVHVCCRQIFIGVHAIHINFYSRVVDFFFKTQLVLQFFVSVLILGVYSCLLCCVVNVLVVSV